MQRAPVIGMVAVVWLAGCAGPLTNTSPPATETPGTDSQTSADRVEGITVRYLDSFTEADKERPTLANHSTEASFTIGDPEDGDDAPEPHGYAIVNTAETSYTVEVRVTHGKAILETRSVRLAPGDEIEITMYAPRGEPTRLTYRTTITVTNGTPTSRLRIITPAESFDCNMKGVDVVIHDGGRTSAHTYSTLAACKDTQEQ